MIAGSPRNSRTDGEEAVSQFMIVIMYAPQGPTVFGKTCGELVIPMARAAIASQQSQITLKVKVGKMFGGNFL